MSAGVEQMIKVDSRKTISRVTSRFMQNNRGRNLIVVIAIMMTTVMFTALFTAALSMIVSSQQMEMRSMMDTSHIRAQDLTKEQFEQIRTDKEIEEYGFTIYLTQAENLELGNSLTELKYADEKGAESRLSKPTKGRLPRSSEEAAMSTITLDLLGVPHQIGSKVKLTYTLQGKTETTEFVLSGYWKGDQLLSSQPVWISKSFCEAHIVPATEESIRLGNSEGAYDLAMWFESPFGLMEKVRNMNQTYHIAESQGRIATNTAFDIFGDDGFPVDAVLIVLFVIFAAGYLIIFNVFNISVKNDMRAYGLLKNMGATGRQLKRIVRRQALILSAIGIPIGLLMGYFAGKAMSPYLADNMDDDIAMEVVTSSNPLIFIAAVLLSLITVYIGCQRPAHLVSKLSPVEAVKETAEAGGQKKKPTGKISPITMAKGNLRRTWKKAVVVVISLVLPIIILNSIYSIVQGFHFEYFVNAYISVDFKLSGCTHNAKTSNLNAITPDVVKAVEAREEVKSMAIVYNTEYHHTLSDGENKNMKKILREAGKILDDQQMERERGNLESGRIASHVMGINEDAFRHLDFTGKSCSWEQFQSGDYVITGSQEEGFGQYYRAGDRVRVEIGEGKSREYTVLAVGDFGYDLRYPFAIGTYFYHTFILPADEYLQLGGDGKGAMVAGIETKEGMTESFDHWLKSYIEGSEKSLYLESKISLRENAQAFAHKYYLVLGLLCGVLFIIGVMNFFNTMAVSILSRKKELALLEAVGMTKGQIMKMLIAEGMFYLISALLIADTAGSLLSLIVIKKTVGRAFFFTSQITVTMSLLALPVFLLIAILVPIYNYKKMSRETIVERLRNE